MTRINWPVVAAEFMVWLGEMSIEYSKCEGVSPPLRYIFHMKRQIMECGDDASTVVGARSLIFKGVARHHDAGALHHETAAFRRRVSEMLTESVSRHTLLSHDEASRLVLSGERRYAEDTSGSMWCVSRSAGSWCRLTTDGAVTTHPGLDPHLAYRVPAPGAPLSVFVF